MRTQRKTIVNAAAGLALTAGFVLPITGAALEVHKWTDEQGIVHYSESPPPDSIADMAAVETLELNDEYEPAVDAEENYRSMLAVANELEKSRLARERARAERQAQERAQLQQIMAAASAYPALTSGYPIGYSSGYFPYHRGFPFFPGLNHGFFPHDPHSGLLNRGQSVPDVRFRSFQHQNMAAPAGTGAVRAIRLFSN